MRLCVLHAGQPKTGTTSLQTWLSANASGLRAHGVLYPLLGRTEGEKKRQHGKVLREIAGQRKLGRRAGLAGELEAEIAAEPHDVLLLSAEYLFNALFFRERAAIRDWLGARGYRIETLAWLRDQPDYLNSAYVQQVKKAHEVMDFDAYVERRGEADPEEGTFTSTWYGRLALPRHRRWGRHGFRPYGAAVRDRGIEADFMAALAEVLDRHGLAQGLAAAAARDFAPPERANESDGPVMVAAGRRIARLLAGSYRKRRLKFVTAGAYDILAAVLRELGIREPRYSALTPDRYARIRDRYRETNALFARRIWGRDWEEVFPERDPAALRSNDIDESGDAEGLRAVEEVVSRVMPRIERMVRQAERQLDPA